MRAYHITMVALGLLNVVVQGSSLATQESRVQRVGSLVALCVGIPMLIWAWSLMP